MENVNQLTPAQAERLSLLAEECAEVIQVVGKILRHGFDSVHPNGGPNNRQLLEKELGDVRFAERLMVENPNGGTADLSLDRIALCEIEKSVKAHKYLHYNKHYDSDLRGTTSMGITVNGEVFEIETHGSPYAVLEYSEVCEMADIPERRKPTITYKYGNHSGMMAPGDRIAVPALAQAIFFASVTNNA